MNRLFFIILLVLLIISSCKSPQEEPLTELETYQNAHLLVDVDQLNYMLLDENTFLIDTRSDSSGSFIPDAVHFSSRGELGDPNHTVSNYLIGPELFQKKMRDLGLNQDHNVVIMDKGNNRRAARLFYALEYYGFSNASLLNGGLAAWLDEGFPTSDVPNQAEPGNFTAEVQPSRFCDYETVLTTFSDPDKIIFDVRSEEEFTGQMKRAEKSGHIPNAVHLEWSDVLEPEGIPYFKPASEIRELYASAGLTPNKEIIPYCQSNVRASHAYFTLRLMGYDSVRPYEGSWAEYGNREESVVE